MSPESHFSIAPQEREPKTPPREVVQEIRNDSFKIAQKHVERLAVINPALLEAPEIQRQIVELARSAAKEKFPEYDFSWLNIAIDKEGSIKVTSLEKTPEEESVVKVVGFEEIGSQDTDAMRAVIAEGNRNNLGLGNVERDSAGNVTYIAKVKGQAVEVAAKKTDELMRKQIEAKKRREQEEKNRRAA